MSIKHRFASAVYRARKENHLTQEKAAEALDISVRWYQLIEYGKRLPSTTLALKIIVYFEIDGKALGVDADYVSGRRLLARAVRPHRQPDDGRGTDSARDIPHQGGG